jgi:hypothetical protein
MECNNVLILILAIICLNWNQHVNLYKYTIGLSTSYMYNFVSYMIVESQINKDATVWIVVLLI